MHGNRVQCNKKLYSECHIESACLGIVLALVKCPIITSGNNTKHITN